MSGYNFSERVRRVLANARQEAAARQHVSVEPEHLLMALIAEGDGVSSAILSEKSVDLDALRDRAVEKLPSAHFAFAAATDIPYSAGSKRLLELCMSEAQFLGHSYVGTEHLLSALAQGAGHTRELLTNVGVDVTTVRAGIRRLVGDTPSR